MPERNIPRDVVSLMALIVAAFLTGFLAPLPWKMGLFGIVPLIAVATNGYILGATYMYASGFDGERYASVIVSCRYIGQARW
jgi:hypothetical protein